MNRAVGALVVWLASLAILWGGWAWLRPELTIQLGSTTGLSDGHRLFAVWWMLAGTVAVILLARVLEPFEDRIAGLFERGSGRVWAIGLMGLALGGGLVAHYLVLGQMPVTDDESAYRFSAQLVAMGRVSIPSPPDKLFWDRPFMVNDGTLYSQYFLGWPALLAPFDAIGLPGLANPLLFALSVPAWLMLLGRFVPSRWARASTLLLVLSPMLLLGAGTLLSHTSCLWALSWAFWTGLRARDEDAPWWMAGAFGLFFSIAFFIRPLTALGLGLPLILWVGWTVLAHRWWARAGAFLVPSVSLAALFLSVNQWQNGSPLSVAYQRTLEYAVANGYRFSQLPEGAELPAVANFGLDDPLFQVGVLAAGVLRLSLVVFGWPMLLFLVVDVPRRGWRIGYWVGTLVSFLLFHATLESPGIDTIGPVHFFELSLPLTAVFALTLDSRSRAGADRLLGMRPWPLWAAAVLLSTAFYLPVRAVTAQRIAATVERTWEVVGDLEGAVVYTHFQGWVVSCDPRAPGSYRNYRPNPRPDFADPVLFANHLDVSADRAHRAAHFPDREGYVLNPVPPCDLQLVPLDAPEADSLPAGAQTRRLPEGEP